MSTRRNLEKCPVDNFPFSHSFFLVFSGLDSLVEDILWPHKGTTHTRLFFHHSLLFFFFFPAFFLFYFILIISWVFLALGRILRRILSLKLFRAELFFTGSPETFLKNKNFEESLWSPFRHARKWMRPCQLVCLKKGDFLNTAPELVFLFLLLGLVK